LARRVVEVRDGVNEAREPRREVGVVAATRGPLDEVGRGGHRHRRIGLRQRHREGAPTQHGIGQPAHSLDQPLRSHGESRV
jgi:hypothetical protein